MRVTVLAVPGCPNVALLEERLARVLGDHPGATVSRLVVTDERQAVLLGMHGSPTILVDGIDPFGAPGQQASMSCRLYWHGDGPPDGAPSESQLRQALGER